MTTDEQRQELLDLRYGKGNGPDKILWNEQIEGLLRHRSVRAYLPDPLPEGAVETLVAAAQSASTSSNLHQWSVVAVSDPELKARIAETTRMHSIGMGNPYINEAPVFLLWIADLSRSHAITTEAGGRAEVLEHLDAFLTSSLDAALAAQNAAVAAESLGLGTVYIGASRNRAEELAELIDLPPFSFVAFGLVVGRPDPERPTLVRPRPSQDMVLHHDRYGAGAWKSAAEDYETVFQQWREDSGMREKTWKDAVAFSSGDVAVMDGRENLRATVQERGFELR
ncbi:nitroreductase family protein [[Kitasatospora] papulosa]|uniref:nitroreductase family protein n=1 Tax=Streptomyces TaxID=1883 RepID=UPI0002C6E1C5|nr:nitroreductase family protein [Streptomyces sp. PAMC 26508]AGJ58341.1 oxygen-insensitive NADPH nitroreductase [Streptomyces sp. PAMC 26508]